MCPGRWYLLYRYHLPLHRPSLSLTIYLWKILPEQQNNWLLCQTNNTASHAAGPCRQIICYSIASLVVCPCSVSYYHLELSSQHAIFACLCWVYTRAAWVQVCSISGVSEQVGKTCCHFCTAKRSYSWGQFTAGKKTVHMFLSEQFGH